GRRLHVVDLHSIRRRRPGRRGLLRMLGMLAGSTRPPGVSHEDQVEFLRAFLARWQGSPGASEGTLARWAGRVKAAQEGLRRRHLRSRTRRCVVRSTMFTIEKAGGFLVHRRRDFSTEAALDAVRMHAAAVAGEAHDASVLHRGRRAVVTVCPCDAVPPFGVSRPAPAAQVGPGRVCVKSFRRESWAARFKDALRLRSRARAAWVAAHGFGVRGIPAARPLALLESRTKLSGAPDYLITEALDNDGTLGELAAGGLPAGARRCQLGKAVAALLDLLARGEVYHPDTKPSNLLVKEGDGRFRLWLVDLDRVKFASPWTRNRWAKCLARLNAGLPATVTLLDRMRCLRGCGRGRWSGGERLLIARQCRALSLKRRTAW
ncbi:MAG: hypothetical protein KAX19_01720, partial [Candidatus Brocadiae bacterium]|nr:hypothetical protein [Candidatus Brocadiia bacterium]